QRVHGNGTEPDGAGGRSDRHHHERLSGDQPGHLGFHELVQPPYRPGGALSMTDIAQRQPHPDLPPPASEVGVVGWTRKHLFSSPMNTALTIAAIYLIYLIVPPLVNWAIIDANWGPGTSRAACTLPGACWTMIQARFGLLMYGFYPIDQRWRVDLTFLMQ